MFRLQITILEGCAVLGSNKREAVTAGITAEVADGIWRIVLPTPWPVGPVNVYLIDDDPLTLVDTGPIHGPALEALEAALAERGRQTKDLERIIITHQHPDHWGLARPLAGRSGAALCALDEFDAWLAAYPSSLEREDRFADELIVRHGGDPSASGGIYRNDVDFAERAEITHPLRNGDVVEFADRRLRVLHRPGHSRSDTVLHDDDRRVMIGADHVMVRPSVPLLSPPLSGPASPHRHRALATYKTSLRRTRAMDIEVVLPGHGDPLHDAHAVIDERLARYARGTERVGAVVDHEPRTALEIATLVRGRIAARTVFFAICETLGYLDELLDAGAVLETEVGGVARFRAV
jgi:glyoxylase-like metal-dependent hydrolase (beta-lactamase superfamily II)